MPFKRTRVSVWVPALTVYRLDADRTAQGCCSEGDRYGGEDVDILTFEYRMLGYNCLNQEITSLAAVHARLTTACTTYTLAIIDTGRNGNLKFLLSGNITASIAVRAFFFDHLALAAAVRTGLDILHLAKEGLLGVDNLTFTAALLTGLW